MDLFKGDKADIWAYSEGTPDDWKHVQGGFNKTYSRLDCCFQPLSSKEMIELGVLEVSTPMRYVTFATELLTSLGINWSIVDLSDNSVWRIKFPPIRSKHIRGYWSAVLETDSDIDPAISTYYHLTN